MLCSSAYSKDQHGAISGHSSLVVLTLWYVKLGFECSSMLSSCRSSCRWQYASSGNIGKSWLLIWAQTKHGAAAAGAQAGTATAKAGLQGPGPNCRHVCRCWGCCRSQHSSPGYAASHAQVVGWCNSHAANLHHQPNSQLTSLLSDALAFWMGISCRDSIRRCVMELSREFKSSAAHTTRN